MNTSQRIKSSEALFFYALTALAVPCVALLFTERTSLSSRLCGVALPVTAYWLLLTLSRNIGRTVWLMFFFIFLSAFQIVLLFLFGNGPIAVDMFLNIMTTNGGEVSELLGNLLPAIATVVLLYVPLLVVAVMAMRRKTRLDEMFRKTQRCMAAYAFAASLTVTAACAAAVPAFGIVTDIFPINACYNLVLAVKRAYLTAHYHESAASFGFGAKATHNADEREIYVLVIGETARAGNFGIYGYDRNTTPRLAATHGLTVFRDAITQSNTTHKSVPMLLSPVSPADYDSIYYRKGIIAAFREAGFRTAFFSNQQPNHSFIDFFGSEAHSSIFIKDDAPADRNITDMKLKDYMEHEIAAGHNKLFIVLHTYGSHFTYNERYEADDAVFCPDTDMSADRRNRENLINAYDNTIRQTDRLLADITDILNNSGATAAMLYTADHGEDIFDDGSSFLHASPIPSYYQLHVPLIVWTSETYAVGHPDVVAALQANSHRPVGTSTSVFHTMLSLAGISTPWRNDSLSVADKRYTPYERRYLTDHNRPRSLRDMHMTEHDIMMFKKNGVAFY